jgi:hypothetical protein
MNLNCVFILGNIYESILIFNLHKIWRFSIKEMLYKTLVEEKRKSILFLVYKYLLILTFWILYGECCKVTLSMFFLSVSAARLKRNVAVDLKVYIKFPLTIRLFTLCILISNLSLSPSMSAFTITLYYVCCEHSFTVTSRYKQRRVCLAFLFLRQKNSSENEANTKHS